MGDNKEDNSYKLTYILERDHHFSNNLSHYYSRINIILTLAGIIVTILAVTFLNNLIYFQSFIFSFFNLIIVILYSIKSIYPFRFRNYNNKVKREYDLFDLSDLFDREKKITLEHFLIKTIKHCEQRNKRNNDLLRLCYFFANFIILFAVSVVIIGFSINDFLIVIMIQLITSITSIVILCVIYKFKG